MRMIATNARCAICRGASHDQELVLEDKGLRNYGTDAARTEQAGQGSNEMDKKNDQIAHRRIVAGREILRKYGRNNNSPTTRISYQPQCGEVEMCPPVGRMGPINR